MSDIPTIREYYRRLNHSRYGVTELAVIDVNGGKGVIATGFFTNEGAFVKACQAYNGIHNLYARRNPRPYEFPRVPLNALHTHTKQRGRDADIEHLTAVSLDIDPVRPKGTSATEEQHRQVIDFALRLHRDLGGWVDDSGNGAYAWFGFETPIQLTDENRASVKEQCREWQYRLMDIYQPEKYGLRIDGCYDFSRLKKVIGTMSVKGAEHRLSGFVRRGTLSDRIRDAILEMPAHPRNHSPPRNGGIVLSSVSFSPVSSLPEQFLNLLQTNAYLRSLWSTSEPDRSAHDWELGCACLEAGITDPTEIAAILMNNPFGKYQRDRRQDYLEITVLNLMKNGHRNS